MFRMSSLPPRGTCAAHAPPLDHLDTDSSSRRGHTSGSERWKDALTAHFQQLSTIKPRISSRFAYRDRLRKASRKGPTTIRASCQIHATLWGCERNARTWCRGSSWQGTAGKTFLWDYVTTSSEMWGRARLSLKVHQCPGSLGLSSRSPRALSIYVLPVWHIHRRVTLLHYMHKNITDILFFYP